MPRNEWRLNIDGCNPASKVAQISGTVTFKGKPVPAGYITFTPDVASDSLGQVVGFQIQNGKYDSKANVPSGLPPEATRFGLELPTNFERTFS